MRKGLLNTCEHLLTRLSDGLFTLILIRVLSPELFSGFVFEQSKIAIILFFAVAPEILLYRDYAYLEAHKSDVFTAIRGFTFLKVILLFFLGLQLHTHFDLYLLAFSTMVLPQLIGPEKEGLRLSHRFFPLLVLTGLHKLILLFAILFLHHLLLGVWIFVVQSIFVVIHFYIHHVPFGSFSLGWTKLKSGFKSFILAHHVSGIILLWMQTTDVLLLGILYPKESLGFYGACVKLGNLFTALPLAFSNYFSVLISRKQAQEHQLLVNTVKLNGLFSAIIFFLSMVFFKPMMSVLFPKFSTHNQSILFFIQLGSIFFSMSFPLTAYLSVRMPMAKLLRTYYFPLGLLGLITYGILISYFHFLGGAIANTVIGLFFFLVALIIYSKDGK